MNYCIKIHIYISTVYRTEVKLGNVLDTLEYGVVIIPKWKYLRNKQPNIMLLWWLNMVPIWQIKINKMLTISIDIMGVYEL